MNVELVHVQTADGVRLDGALRSPATATPPSLGIDLVICHHGVGGNFYGPYFFDAAGDRLLASGCAVLRVNNRGHDQVVNGPHGKLGAQYEVVDDSRHDWRAWLDFAAQAGYRRVALWGHSLGAVKTIYYQSVERDPRVVCAIASSPPRFAYEAYLASEQGARFRTDMERALACVAAGEPEAMILAAVPLETAFAARTYVDKYGPGSRYDFFTHAPRSAVPLLLTLGELEVAGLAFRDLAARGPALPASAPQITYALIEGADHSYTSRLEPLWDTVRTWLSQVGTPRSEVGVR